MQTHASHLFFDFLTTEVSVCLVPAMDYICIDLSRLTDTQPNPPTQLKLIPGPQL